jgi:hypothetical protein
MMNTYLDPSFKSPHLEWQAVGHSTLEMATRNLNNKIEKITETEGDR